ncbi:hypothetical protein M6I34_17540 [Burkholderiaceae bacterium FT117]|uniref:hypothetical protein n=1 Tax=Zeimonas sediminis TaxID=2944268 RepID=UPI002342F0E6|nr:hypothetical protein [Zeimonas sediminis]MCM5572321.1 hypothetical protein [Zeimonas sediminis]
MKPAITFALAAAVVATTAFAQPGTAPRAAAKAPEKAEGRRPAPPASSGDLYWYEEGTRRALRVDAAQVADFGRKDASRGRMPLRASRDTEKDPAGLPDGVSPVLRDTGAPGRPRALPGGVIVTLRTAPAGNDAGARQAEAHRQLAAAGLQPLRALDPEARRWLVASPAGLASLELANRLHESGDFAAAAPNWWQPRALK